MNLYTFIVQAGLHTHTCLSRFTIRFHADESTLIGAEILRSSKNLLAK
jgi:hypothetical protein